MGIVVFQWFCVRERERVSESRGSDRQRKSESTSSAQSFNRTVPTVTCWVLKGSLQAGNHPEWWHIMKLMISDTHAAVSAPCCKENKLKGSALMCFDCNSIFNLFFQTSSLVASEWLFSEMASVYSSWIVLSNFSLSCFDQRCWAKLSGFGDLGIKAQVQWCSDPLSHTHLLSFIHQTNTLLFFHFYNKSLEILHLTPASIA